MTFAHRHTILSSHRAANDALHNAVRRARVGIVSVMTADTLGMMGMCCCMSMMMCCMEHEHIRRSE